MLSAVSCIEVDHSLPVGKDPFVCHGLPGTEQELEPKLQSETKTSRSEPAWQIQAAAVTHPLGQSRWNLPPELEILRTLLPP